MNTTEEEMEFDYQTYMKDYAAGSRHNSLGTRGPSKTTGSSNP